MNLQRVINGRHSLESDSFIVVCGTNLIFPGSSSEPSGSTAVLRLSTDFTASADNARESVSDSQVTMKEMLKIKFK